MVGESLMANKSLLALCCLLAVQSVVMWRMITKNSSGVKPEVEYDPPNSDPLQEAWNAMVRSDSTFVWDPNGPDPMPGVHMVYMYANGSDPAVARAREEFGGSATRTFSTAAGCYAHFLAYRLVELVYLITFMYQGTQNSN